MRGAIEGDFVETREGLIFDVKGFYHPKGRITAYLRYYPSPQGERERNGVPFKKVYDLKERESFLKKCFPHYLYEDSELGLIQAVPEENINVIHRPREFLHSLKKKKMHGLEKKSSDFCTLLSKVSGVPLSRLGISGSLLLGLSGKDSDMDVIVYGKDNGSSVYAALRRLRDSGLAKSLHGKMLERTCLLRWGHVDEGTRRRESEKLLHGSFSGKPYFIRLLRRPRRKRFKQLGISEVEGMVMDASEGIFTPCVFRIKSDKAERLCSYRGRYCEHLKRGDRFSVKARLERVLGDGNQLMLEGERISIL